MFNINIYVKNALAEDFVFQDITTDALISPHSHSRAQIIIKEPAVICGMPLLKQSFKSLDPTMRYQSFCNDGDHVKKNKIAATIEGKTRAILSGERVALNFLSYLSGIATQTYHFVERVKPYKTQIMDTRKTIPGLRDLQKYAVRCGGGVNHRRDLNGFALIKDNHRQYFYNGLTIRKAVKLIRKKTRKIIEVEVDTFNQFKEALESEAQIILLDNMNLSLMRKCQQYLMRMKGKRPQLEASGGINLHNVRSVAKLGIERISIGALTHSFKSIDVSLEIIP